MSQSEAADLCGMTKQEFSRIVNGTERHIGEKRGKRIADALGWKRPWKELFEEVRTSPLATAFDSDGNVVVKIERCICETGESKSMGDGMCDTKIEVACVDGVWGVSVYHPDNYGPCRYEPINHCPICGKEL